MTDDIATWTTTRPAETITMDSIEEAIRSLADAPVVTIVGGKSVERLMARLGFQKTRAWLLGTDFHRCDLLPDDFLLVGREQSGVVRLFVYKLKDGAVQAFEVMPGYVLYRAWQGIVGRFKRKEANQCSRYDRNAK